MTPADIIQAEKKRAAQVWRAERKLATVLEAAVKENDVTEVEVN